MLALQWDASRQVLALLEVDPVTLAPTGASLDLRDKSVTAWSRSPDGKLLALGPWNVPRITIVEREGLRVVREIALRNGFYAQALAWVAPGRLLALVGSCCKADWWIAAIDPDAGRVLTERTVAGRLRGTAPLPDGLALLLTPRSIGPARLAVARADGGLSTVALPRTLAGTRRLPGNDYRVAIRMPGLAVDPAGRAYVVGPDEPVAQVDLHTLRVTYHSMRTRTLQARMKSVEGPERQAAWLGDGVLAVTGTNTRRAANGRTRREPAGVHLIDTRSWQRRTLAARGQAFAATGGTIVIADESGLTAFGPDGGERFRVPGRFGWVQAVAGRAYAWRADGGMLVVDLATGASTSSAIGQAPTLLQP